MFKGKSKSEFFAETTGTNAASLISAGTTLTGDINSNSDLRIDGTLVGNINSTAKVIIGANGTVKGDINGQQADILGKVTGAVKVKELLQLKGSSVVQGNIHAGKLQVEPTATFNGECHMNITTGTDKQEKTEMKDKADAKLMEKNNVTAVQ
jgi:cytoskeletal protein CcmA (bactofilin family)